MIVRIAPFVLVATTAVLGLVWSERSDARSSPCSAATTLNDIADALTSGSDANVLRVALAGEIALEACGDERDSIAAELIAADAYGDVNAPAKRCSALADAAARNRALGDAARARAIARARVGCR